ncbi:hypothetical protein EMCRGX_G020496 [Ephydatia muelleri]
MATWTERLRRWRSQDSQKAESVESGDTGQKQQASTSEGQEPAAEPSVKAIEELQQKLKEAEDKYLRALAETENVRKRMSRLIEEAQSFGIQTFAKDILEVADYLDKALQSVPKAELEQGKNTPLAALYEGLRMTEGRMQKVFAKNGLKKIHPVEGEVFDPSLHEAMMELDGKKPGTVAVVASSGYSLNGRTVRPAKKLLVSYY